MEKQTAIIAVAINVRRYVVTGTSLETYAQKAGTISHATTGD